MWPFRTKADPPPAGQKSVGGYYFATPLLQPAPASYGRLAKEGYGQNAVAYACANKIGTAVASVELHQFRTGGKDVERLEGTELLGLLDRPNPLQSGPEFLRALATYFALSGNAYLFGSGIDPRGRGRTPPRELQLLSPAHVEVAAGPRIGWPLAYEFKPDAANRYTYPLDQLTGRSAVLHLKTFHPLSPWYGMAPMDAAAIAIDMHNAGNVWNYSLLKQGARPSGALMLKGQDGQPATLTDEQFARLRAMLDDQFSGAGNSGRPLLLEGGLEWKEMSINPKDMEYLEGKNSAARDIALAFGVPPQLLGIPGDNTYANYEQATLAFWTETVLPLLQLILGGLNRWLTPHFDEDSYLWYDEEMIPALEPLRKAKGDRINAASYLEINEKRAAMGHDSVDGGDVVFVPSTSIPLDLAGEGANLAEPGSLADQSPGPEPAENS